MSDKKPSTTGRSVLDPRSAGLCLGLAAAVFASVWLGIKAPRGASGMAPIWLANAWVLAAMLRSRAADWPLLATAGFLGGVVAGLSVGISPANVLTFMGCCALEWFTVGWTIRRFCGSRFDIDRPLHLLAFVCAALGGALLSSCAALNIVGVRPGDAGQMEPVLRRLAGLVGADMIGLLILTPPLLILTQGWHRPFKWREAWTLAVLAAVSVVVLMGLHYPFLFMISAVLTLPTWRMGLPGAVAGVVIIAAVGVAALATGHGPLMIVSPQDRVTGLQIFLAVSFLTSVPVAVARDASETLKARLRAALTEARVARAEAEHAAAVKTDFLANMSHELRTPLTSVVGFTRLAADQPDLSVTSRGYIDRVNEASRALLCAVNDILDFSKLEAGQVTFHPQSVPIEPLLRTVLDLFTPQATAKDLTLTLEDATPAGLTVTLDPDRLRQVLLNLVGNAVKFTPRGVVALGAHYDEAGGRLVVSVSDTGPGISAADLDRLFKRFSQVDGSLTRGHGGTGLGLAICKGIVEAMGGEIGASSQVGRGSRFTLAVPAARQEILFVDPDLGDEAVIRPGIRVLVTDDHAANRDLVKLFLASIEAEVTEATDGQAALGLAALQPFDVILMDLRMPKLDGFGAVAALRSEPGLNRTTPILAFTADAERLAGGHLEDVGFNGAVAKPVEPAQLITAIAGALAKAGASNELDLNVA